MALFTINRYTGDDLKEQKNLKRKSSDGLKELKYKAKLKKHNHSFETQALQETKEETSPDQLYIDKNVLENNEYSTLTEICNARNTFNKKTIKDGLPESICPKASNVEHTKEMFIIKNDTNNKRVIKDCEQKNEDTSGVLNDDYDPTAHFKEAVRGEIGGFTVLGEQPYSVTNKVSRKLPDWLTHPNIVEDVAGTSDDLIEGIDEILVNNLNAIGITKLFPVQKYLIPAILKDTKYGIGPCTFQPNDICVSAPTGSGKTIAFALPIIQSLFNRVVPCTRALVVLPTRELAAQVHKVFIELCKNTTLRCTLISGMKGKFEQEQKILLNFGKNGISSPADIVVATPGRLVDHLKASQLFTLQHLRFLVIDEADRMMDHIKNEWLSIVEDAVYAHRRRPGKLNTQNLEDPTTPLQKLLFSATLSADPEKLERLKLFQPRLYTAITKPTMESANTNSQSNATVELRFVGKYTTPAGLKEYMVVSPAGIKPLITLHIALNLNKVLCFTGSLEATKRLTILIQLYAEKTGLTDFSCAEFSSLLSTSKKKKILKQFESGKINILVCSDAMARGMDIRGISHVILYDAPKLIKTYIHRIGRTARAGDVGTAYTLLKPDEAYHFKKMLKDAGKHVEKKVIPRHCIDEMEPLYEEILPLVAQKLKSNKR